MIQPTTEFVGERIEHDTEVGRLRALERVFDPATARLLDEHIHVGPVGDAWSWAPARAR